MYSDAQKAANKKYYETHRQQINAYMRTYKNNRYKTDELYRRRKCDNCNEIITKRYHNDPEFRATVLQKKKVYYQMKKNEKAQKNSTELVI